jgi:hypothetical protein
LWLPIIIVLLLVVLHAVFDILRSPVTTPENARINQTAEFLSLLLTLAWWYLIAAAIYGEVVPGDRQFWITRPYSWRSLLGAKVLFVLLFVNIPLLISDCFVLGTQSFPVLSSLPSLILRQIPFSFLFVLGAFVLGTLTRGVAQFVLGWFLLFLGTIAESFIWQRGAGVAFNVPGAEDSAWQWVQFALVIAIAIGIVVWQYATRRTMAGRTAFAVSVFVIVPAISMIPVPGRTRFLMYSSAIKPQVDFSQIHIRYDLENASACAGQNPVSPAFTTLALPLRIDGLPSGTALLGSAESQLSGLHDGSKLYSTLQRSANTYCLPISIQAAKFRSMQFEPVTLYTSLYLTAVDDRPTVTAEPSAKVITIPEVGVCEPVLVAYDFVLSCRAGVRPAKAALLRLEAPGFRSEPVEIGQFRSRLDLISGLSPVQKWLSSLAGPSTSPARISAALRQPAARLVFTVERPLGYGVKELRGQNVRLGQYVIRSQEGIQ